MYRTQIYLDDDIYKFLENEKKKTRLSYSEIIRNNIRQNIKQKQSLIIRRMEKAAGSWGDLSKEPEDIVNELRKDRPL